MEYVVGIILLLSFFGLAYYCIKGHNLMIGFLCITILWTVLPLAGTLFASADDRVFGDYPCMDHSPAVGNRFCKRVVY